MNLQDIAREAGLDADFTRILVTGALLLARILPVLVMSPMLGGEIIPNEVKIGVGLALAVVLYPAVSLVVGQIPLSPLPVFALLLKEVFLGITLAFIVSMVFEAAQMAGTMVDMFAGTNMAQILVPQISTQVSLFSSLKLQIAVVLFLSLNGHHMVINALADSLLTVPLHEFPKFSQGAWPFFEMLIRIFADLLQIGLAIAAPAFITTFLTDFSLGMINRVAPQIQVFFVGMSLKPMAATVVMMIAMHLVIYRLNDEFGAMLGRLFRAIRLLG